MTLQFLEAERAVYTKRLKGSYHSSTSMKERTLIDKVHLIFLLIYRSLWSKVILHFLEAVNVVNPHKEVTGLLPLIF